MIKITTTVDSVEQAEELLIAGVDEIYFGEDYFGLRLPASFARKEQKLLVEMAHNAGKKTCVALNAIMHNEHIEKLPEYLKFLKDIGVDSVTLGDPGVIQVMKKNDLHIPFKYDAQVVVTNSRQLNFFAKKGAIEGVIAREVPKLELIKVVKNSNIPVEMLVYGPTCIQQSRRPLLENYFNYIKKYDSYGKE